MIRVFDLVISILGIILLSPLLLYIAIRVKLDSRGNIFYKQLRVGKGLKEFYLYKFRTMKANSDAKDLLTYGNFDIRITKFGAFLRRKKLDELPQLFNVIRGDMSIVGPRPEVKKYVDTYSEEQLDVLSVKPGITDQASIEYLDESELLAKQTNPEDYYIKYIIPEKIQLNRSFINDPSVSHYWSIIFKTIKKIAAN